MKFRILGPLAVETSSGRSVECAWAADRSTLIVLLLLARQRVTRRTLIDALWDGHQDTAALRQRLTRVRAVIGAGRLETTRAGPHRSADWYRLVVHPGELDADDFRDLVGDGMAAMDSGDPEGAARALQQAENLWREPAWQDLPPTPAAQAAAARLDEQRADAREALADARLALGQHRELVAMLRVAADANPHREHTWAQLVRALYRCGRTDEALAAHARARARLAADLGLDPGPELAELHRQILARDPALMPAARPVTATPAATALPAWSPVRQMPASVPDFTGRLPHLEALDAQLSGAGVAIILITGPPGAGKTALAVHAAHRAYDLFPDGQLYAFLDGTRRPQRHPQDVLAEMLRALGVPAARIPPAGLEREALYRSMLAGRKVLIVADDAATSAQIRPLLPGTAGSAVVVTSRYRIADLEAAHLIELAEMSQPESTALLSKISGTDDDAALASIAASCGGLPLALRAAGARLAFEQGLTPAYLATELARGDRLAALALGDLSVRDRLSTAYQLLEADSRRAFRLASVAPAGGDLPSWLIPALPASPAASSAIARTGLLTPVVDSAGQAPRYRMHPLVRDYAAGLRAAEDGPEISLAAARRLTAAWLELADRACRQLAPHPCQPTVPALTAPHILPESCAAITDDATGWYTAERCNLLAVTKDACARGDHATAAQLADRQFASLCEQQAYAQARHQWEAVAAAATAAGDTLAAARARYRVGVLAVIHGDSQLGPGALLSVLRGCLVTFRLADDRTAAADTLYLLSLCALDDDLHAAQRYAESGLHLAQLADDQRAVSLTMSMLGLALTTLGSAEGIIRCEEAAAIAAQLGTPALADLTGRALARASGHAAWPERANLTRSS
jgi:DNA-binding SARP family transcriptional activator